MPRQSCPGRTGEIWAGRLLRGIQEAFHLCGRKNEKFPLDFMKIKAYNAINKPMRRKRTCKRTYSESEW